MSQSSASSYCFGFLLIAATSAASVQFAPNRPESWFVAWCWCKLRLIGAILVAIKRSEPRPVNWVTVDVLFAGRLASFTSLIFLTGYSECWTVSDRFGTFAMLTCHIPFAPASRCTRVA